MISIEEWVKGYIAGFIDGEGTITIIHHKERKNPNLYRLEPKLEISNTNKEVLKFILKYLPPSAGLFYQEESRNPKWKDRYSIRLQKQLELRDFLIEIEPYLIVKKKQAELMIEFLNVRIEHGRYKKYQEKEKELAEEIRQLNKRGAE